MRAGVFLIPAALLVAGTVLLAADPIIGQAIVIDGDTIEINHQKIRLWGIDAPENDQDCQVKRSTVKCGRQAASALANLTGRSPLRCTPVSEDDSGIHARCYIGTQDIGAWMIEQGHALDWARYSGGRYTPYMERAKRAKRGVWAGTFIPPWEWRSKSQ